ncbi:YveK family protein [Pseudonocardia sp.]|uniref:YveK family protein n=1 Tax=Pseudonocardia sp. TaxID=60912 RepID=UPI003D0DB1F2
MSLRWVIAVLCVLLGVAGGFAYTRLVTPSYESTGYVIATAQATTTTQGTIPGDERRAVQVAQTLSRLVDQQEVRAAAATAAGLTPDQVGKQVQGRAMPESSTIEITGTATTADGAARLVNAVADELVKLNTDRMAATGVTLAVLSPASVPTSPSSPVLVLDVGVGAGAGILLGALYLLATGGSRRSRGQAAPVPLPGAFPVGPPVPPPGPGAQQGFPQGPGPQPYPLQQPPARPPQPQPNRPGGAPGFRQPPPPPPRQGIARPPGPRR